MLELAIRAEIPIISVRTEDRLNLREVLAHISHLPIDRFSEKSPISEETCFWTENTPQKGYRALYKDLLKRGSVLIIVNPDETPSEAFDAGYVPVPVEMVRAIFSAVVPDDVVGQLVKAAHGLTLKQIVEISKLAQAESGMLVPDSFYKIRHRIIGGTKGLTRIEAKQEFYIPSLSVDAWLLLNSHFFLNEDDHRLIPRGILFAGIPGTGKTMAAKYLARKMKVPLYRLDIAGIMGRYVGESEASLHKALSTVDQEAPAIMLIDEVEKLFGEKSDAGVTARLLSQLLWWLQEHESRVLTVMTTNDKDTLPKELYREGRIDKVIDISPLTAKEAGYLGVEVFKQFYPKVTSDTNFLIKGMFEKGDKIPHAEVVNKIYDFARRIKLEELKNGNS